jgi:transposase
MRRGAKTAKKKSRDVPLEELNGILARTRSVLSKEDQQTLEEAVDTLAVLTVELEKKGTSIRRLRQMLFGARTEKTSTIFKDEDLLGEQESGNDPGGDGDSGPSDQSIGTATTNGSRPKRKVKGHGRNGAADYHGAERVPISHPTLKRGDPCPACPKGKLYPVKEPATLVRITGMAPLQAKVFELARLRCNACNLVFTAPAPEGIGTAKYDETATAMVGLFKYGTGLPWNRLEHVQRWLGMPMPSTTQWELVRDAEPSLAPVFAELVRQAAQGQVVHNDDTAMKVLELMDGAKPFTEEAKTRAASDSDRTGVYTTGIVSRVGERRLALFFTGPRHAGENLETVLKQRAEALAPPIQMSDALSHNTAGDFETIAASCLAHARRRFVDVVHDFPEECKHVLEELRKVYRYDAATKKLRFSDDERLSYHQQLSRPIMDELDVWMKKQLEDRLVEPNSGLGEAIQYMQKHWKKLTLFLSEPGAPLDNNIVEAALKTVILHRKNSLFYKTMNGARVGDTFMSLIHSTELNGGDPFGYLVALLRHPKAAAGQPADWMPWNYGEALARASPTLPGGEPLERASPAPQDEGAADPSPA